MKLGKDLAELTAGIDKLYRSTPRSDGFLDREGLIPVAVASVEPRFLRDYVEATDALRGLAGRLESEAESALRRDYLAEMIDSLLALVTTFQDREISFADRLGTRRVLAVVAILLGLVVVAMSQTTTFVMLAIGITLTRAFGQSALSVVSIATIGRRIADRIDAYLFAAPVFYIVVRYLS